MSQSLVKRGHQQAKKLLLIQAIILVVVASLGLFKEIMVAIALLSGGTAVFLSNCFFVYKAFSKSGAQAIKQVVDAFYFGETVKMNLSAVLLVIAFVCLPGFGIYILVGYIVVLLSQFLAPAVIKNY